MKWQHISIILVGTTIVLNPTVVSSQTSFTRATRVECLSSNQPTTFIESVSNQGRLVRIPYIQWYKVFPMPKARELCQQATNTLRHYSQRNAKFSLSPERINGEYVMCLTRTDKEPCTSKSEKLFTLPSTSREQAEQDISRLFNEGVRRSMGEGALFSTYGNREPRIFGLFPRPRFRFLR